MTDYNDTSTASLIAAVTEDLSAPPRELAVLDRLIEALFEVEQLCLQLDQAEVRA